MAEGIALLSMYNDEEDEDDDPMDVAGTAHQSPNPDGTSVPPGPTPDRTPTPPPPPLPSRTPPPFNGDSDRETLASPIPQSPPPSVQFSLPSRSPPPPAPPPSFPELFDSSRPRTGALAALGIVDYAHDDTAMSPEHEEGEIVSTSHTVMETEIHILEEHFEERTPPGVGIQPDPPQPSGFPEYSAVETHITMEFTRTEVEVVEFEEPVVDSVDVEKDDPLSKFLPSPVTTKCPEELQERINKFLAYKKAGKSFNADLRNRKDYRNPDFLQHAVSYQDIDQIGTCFSKDVFDPHGYDRSDFYDELEADMKREIERKDQERKKIHKVDFVSAGTHSVTTAPMVKTSGQIPAVTAAAAASAAASGLQSVSTTSEATASRHNRKTKWDKVDSDVKIPLQSGGHDDRPTVASHTSSSNAGSGYSAFAQQKRREAEEKKSIERKFEKRS